MALIMGMGICINQDKRLKSKAPNPSQRKKWKKSAIQLVPTVPPPQLENRESQMKPEDPPIETEIPLQLPRAMRSIAMSTNTLRERNSEHQDNLTANKETRTPTPSSPRECGIIRDEKENRGP